jgi:hypothetical protein
LGSIEASGSLEAANVVCHRRPNMRRLFSGCRHAEAEGAVGPAEMHTLPRTDLGSEKGACRLAQSVSLVREVGASSDEAAGFA